MTRKREIYLTAFSPARDPLLFQKIPCHHVALLKDNAICNVSFQFGNILLSVSFTYQRPICMYDYPLNSSLFGIWIEQTLFFATSVECWYTYHKSYITCIDPQFLWVQSIISKNYHPWLYWELVLDNNFLRFSYFWAGLAPILLITSLSNDKAPSVEKPYANFISYANVNKLSPIKSIMTKRCLLLCT